MKTMLRYLAPALLLAGAALALLAGSRIERRLAAADRAFATLDLEAAAAEYDRVAASPLLAARAPGPLGGLRDAVAVRQAAVRYWRGEYAPIPQHQLSPGSAQISIACSIEKQEKPGTRMETSLGCTVVATRVRKLPVAFLRYIYTAT